MLTIGYVCYCLALLWPLIGWYSYKFEVSIRLHTYSLHILSTITLFSVSGCIIKQWKKSSLPLWRKIALPLLPVVGLAITALGARKLLALSAWFVYECVLPLELRGIRLGMTRERGVLIKLSHVLLLLFLCASLCRLLSLFTSFLLQELHYSLLMTELSCLTDRPIGAVPL